jgi:hypothetical protein
MGNLIFEFFFSNPLYIILFIAILFGVGILLNSKFNNKDNLNKGVNLVSNSLPLPIPNNIKDDITATGSNLVLGTNLPVQDAEFNRLINNIINPTKPPKNQVVSPPRKPAPPLSTNNLPWDKDVKECPTDEWKEEDIYLDNVIFDAKKMPSKLYMY